MLKVGQKVKAKIDLIEDLRDEGMGINRCARAGAELYVREISPYTKDRYYVSHDGVLDSSFAADINELEVCE